MMPVASVSWIADHTKVLHGIIFASPRTPLTNSFPLDNENMNMRTFLSMLCLLISIGIFAQYGTFDPNAVKTAKALTTIVVLDDGDSPYNKAIMNAIKADWKFTGSYDFIKAGDLGSQPIAADKLYLLKTSKVDPVKFEGTFLTLVQGWKQKKGEGLQQKDNAFTNVPADKELAFMLIDAKGMNEKNSAQFITLYAKHMQDFLKNVEAGKITDKTTADRLYSSRTRLVRDGQLWIGKEHLDKTVPDLAKVQEFYKSKVEIKPVSELIGAIEKQDREIAVTDVVITGDYKTKHCFKRVFNAGTGELMYQKDEPSLHGKKEGFMDEDLKSIERAR